MNYTSLILAISCCMIALGILGLCYGNIQEYGIKINTVLASIAGIIFSIGVFMVAKLCFEMAVKNKDFLEPTSPV